MPARTHRPERSTAGVTSCNDVKNQTQLCRLVFSPNCLQPVSRAMNGLRWRCNTKKPAKNEKTTRGWFFRINKKLITWKRQLWQLRQLHSQPCWQRRQLRQQQKQQLQPWLAQLQKQRPHQQKRQQQQVLQQQLELVQEQELLLFYRKQPRQQQQSQRSKREMIYSFEIPSKKIDNFRKLFLQSPAKTKQTNVEDVHLVHHYSGRPYGFYA